MAAGQAQAQQSQWLVTANENKVELRNGVANITPYNPPVIEGFFRLH